MTINELIERLEEYREPLGGETEVRLMTQANWPFEYSIAGLASAADMRKASESEHDDITDEDVLVIVEGTQLKYGSKEAWNIAR